MKYNETRNVTSIADLQKEVNEYEDDIQAYSNVPISSFLKAALPIGAAVFFAASIKEKGAKFFDSLRSLVEAKAAGLPGGVNFPIDSSEEAIGECVEEGVAEAARFNTPEGYKCFAVAPTAKDALLRVTGTLCPATAGDETRARKPFDNEFASVVFNEAAQRYKGDPNKMRSEDTPDAATCTVIVQGGQVRYAGKLYKYVPISAAMSIAEKAVTEGFSEAVFAAGEFSHEGCLAVWNLGDSVTKEFEGLYGKTDDTLKGAKAQMTFITSNVSDSSVRLEPRLVLASGVSFAAGKGVSVPHKGENPLARFEAGMKDISKSFTDIPAELDRLEETTVKHPAGCLIKLYKALGRKSKKWIDLSMNFGKMYPECTALDILCEVLENLRKEFSGRETSLLKAADTCDAAARKIMAPNFASVYDVDIALEEEGITPEAEVA